MNMNTTNIPDPSNVITLPRRARKLPKGVGACRTNVPKMSSRELRLLRDEVSGKAPEWTHDGKCFRPVGKWQDTNAGGEYVTANVQKIERKRHVMYNQVVCMHNVLTGNERRFESVTVSDITTEAMKKYGKIKKRGMNITCVHDGVEWVVYV